MARKTYDAEKLTLCLSEFHVENAKKLPEDHEYLFNLRDVFKKAYQKHKPEIKRFAFYNSIYYGERTPDYFGQTDGSKEASRMNFRSGILNECLKTLTSYALKENPIWKIDPYVTENFADAVQLAALTGELGWIQNVIEKFGGFVYEQGPDGEQIMTGVDSEKAQEAFNNIIDQNVTEWFHHDNAKPAVFSMFVTNGNLHGRSFTQLRKVDNKPGAWPGTGPYIIIENIPCENMIEDPEAKTLTERKVLFHIQPREVREIAKEFKISADKIQAMSEYSEIKTDIKPEEENTQKQYKIRKALVVHACCYDDTLVDENFASQYGIDGDIYAYPNGRIITFLPEQDTESSLWILDDKANHIVGGPYFDFIPDPIDELHGRPPAQDVVNDALISEECVQMAQANMRANGNDILFYQEGEEENVQNLTNQIGQKVKVNDISAIQYHKPTGALNDAMNAHLFFKRDAHEKLGINSIREGDNFSSIVSGRAMQVENSRILQVMQLQINQYAAALTKIGTGFLSLFLQIAKKGYRVIYDGKWHQLPFDLDQFIYGGAISVSPDSLVPRDPVSQLNMALQFMNMNAEDGGPIMTRESVLEMSRMENPKKIMADAEKAAGLRDAVDQLMKQNEILTQKNQQMEQALQQAADDVEKAKFAAKTQAGSAQTKAWMLKFQEEQRNFRQEIKNKADLEKAEIEANSKQINKIMEILSANQNQAETQIHEGGPVVSGQ